MSLLEILVGFALLFPVPGKDDGAKYLRNVTEKFSKIKDYTVDIRVHPDLENFKAQDMTAELYYKSPGQGKEWTSRSISILPKEVGAFDSTYVQSR